MLLFYEFAENKGNRLKLSLIEQLCFSLTKGHTFPTGKHRASLMFREIWVVVGWGFCEHPTIYSHCILTVGPTSDIHNAPQNARQFDRLPMCPWF